MGWWGGGGMGGGWRGFFRGMGWVWITFFFFLKKNLLVRGVMDFSESGEGGRMNTNLTVVSLNFFICWVFLFIWC